MAPPEAGGGWLWVTALARCADSLTQVGQVQTVRVGRRERVEALLGLGEQPGPGERLDAHTLAVGSQTRALRLVADGERLDPGTLVARICA